MLNKRILIVDDEHAVLSGLSRAIIKLCGFQGEIITADNGQKTMKAVARSRIDLCFLDINLPDANGVDLMEKIDKHCPETKFVIMTASEVSRSLKKRIDAHTPYFIKKPFDLGLITPIIATELNAAAEQQPGPEAIEPDKEKRWFARKRDSTPTRFSLNIFYTLELKAGLEADIIDISKDGAGILTAYPVHPGNVLRFTDGIEKSGIVKWCRRLNKNYRAGIKFI